MDHMLLLHSLLFMNFGGNLLLDYSSKHCAAINTGSLIGKCNRVCNSVGVTDQEVIDIKTYFGDIPFTWVINENEKPTLALVQKYGLTRRGSFPVMVLDMKTLNNVSYSHAISVKEIHSKQEYSHWIAIVAQSYKIDEKELRKALQYLIGRAPSQTVKLYLGLYNDTPVGASMLIYNNKSIVTLHMVGTLESYRGKGVGKAVTCKPLLDAYAQGYTHAALMASEMGLSLYQKLGFKQIATYVVYAQPMLKLKESNARMAITKNNTDEIVLIADERVLSIPIIDNQEALIDLKDQSDIAYGPSPEIPDNQDYTKMRLTLYHKLIEAQQLLPQGLRFCIYEGYRSLTTQQQLFNAHYQQLQALHTDWSLDHCFEETTRLVSPVINKNGSLNIPPHSTGAALDIYLIDDQGMPVDMGIYTKDWLTDVNGELSATDSKIISASAQMHRKIMSNVLEAVGFVNYPTEYWHWSYGDRYWAYHKKMDHALYGSLEV